MKLTKSKNLTGLVLAVLMALPLFSIASRVIYVQANKNAYQSYSGQNESNVILQNVESFEKDKKYNLQTHANTYDNQLNEAQNYLVASKVFLGDSVYTNIRIGFYRVGGNTEANVYLRELDNNNNLIYTGNLANTNLQVNVSFIYDYQVNTFSNTLYQFFNYQDYMTNYYIDNVFEYSVSQFVKDNDFGNVDLFSYFGNIFLNDSQMNNLYVGFANWYLNYAMLITLMHFLFAILMWFINYSRRILDRSMNYDW